MRTFISYPFKEKELMEVLRRALKKRGIDVYTAEHDLQLGKPLSNKIQDEIDRADAIVVLVTKGETSASVNEEVGYATSRDMHVIPLVEEGARVGVMMTGLERMPFNRNSFSTIVERVADYVSREDTDSEDDEVTLYDETKRVDPAEFEHYDLELGENEVLEGAIVSDIPINVYIMNRRNFKSFEQDDDFSYEYGSENVTRLSIHFQSPKEGKWKLVIDNTDEDEEEASVDVLLKSTA